MKYRRFEELPVWNKAIDLAERTFALTRSGALAGFGGLRDQIERAAVSVSNNIAEGFERGTHEELLTFLYIARGSAGEVRSMLYILGRLPELADRSSDLADLLEMTRAITLQLNLWMKQLKESPSRGPRYQSAATRRASEDAARGKAFLERARRLVEEHHTRTTPPPVEPPPDGPPPDG